MRPFVSQTLNIGFHKPTASQAKQRPAIQPRERTHGGEVSVVRGEVIPGSLDVAIRHGGGQLLHHACQSDEVLEGNLTRVGVCQVFSHDAARQT